jgi:hypothetical protein
MRFGIGFDSVNGEPYQVSWDKGTRNGLDTFIPNSTGFSQSLLKVPAGGNTQ